MMIYAVLKIENDETANLFYSWEDYFRATFDPDIETIALIELGRLKGKTYNDRKSCIESKAIEFSNNQYPGLSWGEMSDIEEYFSRYGSRYGLLTDFHENAIC